MLQLSVITLFLGQTRNRFLVYQDPADIDVALDRAGAASGIGGVELRYPADFADVPRLKAALARNQLGVSAINFASVRNDRWIRGAWTAESAADRRDAVDDCRRALDLAKELGANRITNCPLNDGFDYPFELDYLAAFDHAVGCFEAVCAHAPDVKICIEYKANEPRVRSLIASAGETIAFAEMVGAANLGATLDTGHCFLCAENPALAAAMLARAGRLFYVHLNDNDGRGDWDLTPGTWHTWEFVELFYYLDRLGYDDWFAFDIVAKEHDPVAVFTDASAITEQLRALASKLDPADVRKQLATRNPTATMSALNALL
ncbi:MAG: sugar phosphate isomerase/epimerase family protein [Pseudomonadota bacterium]